MDLNKRRLNLALSTIKKDEGGSFSSGKFIDLMTSVHLNVCMGTKGLKLDTLNRYLKFLNQDIWNIQTIVFKLRWQKELWIQKKLDNNLWMEFCKCDIDQFHVEFRSIFDYIAKIIGIIAVSPGQVPETFEKLRNWIGKSDKNIRKLGKDLAQVVLSCEWFGDLRKIRNSIIHRGGFSLVFPQGNRIFFQIYEGVSKKVLKSGIMGSNNLADFELYGGLYIGYLIAYLEKVSELSLKHLKLTKVNTSGKSYHIGLPTVNDWIRQLLDRESKMSFK